VPAQDVDIQPRPALIFFVSPCKSASIYWVTFCFLHLKCRMKKANSALLIIVFIFNYSFSQSFEWAQRAGLWAFDLGYAIATDQAGNIYASGKYEMNAYFGGTYVSCAGNHDIYLAKYGPDGSFKWVRTAGGKSGDYTHGMACDANGNVYITGEFEYTTDFGGGVKLTSHGGNDIFVAKYNTNGTLIWAKSLGGGSKSDKGLAISLSGNSLYVVGKYEQTANFGGTSFSNAGGEEIVMAKYNTDGVLQWVKKAGGSGDDEAYSVCSDPQGNFYVTGYFSGTANFGGTSITTYGGKDIFIAKYSSSGNLIWLKKAGGGATDYCNGIAYGPGGKLFLTGGFRVKSHFGSITLTAQGGDADIFVACYDNSGNPLWVKKAGGRINDYGRAIAVDNNGNSFITGNYGLSATFGSQVINGSDSTELYFASYDASGNLRWLLTANGPADKSDPDRFIEMGLSIALDPSQKVVASGTYRSSSTFGSTTLKPWDHTEIFIAKIKQPGQVSYRDEVAAVETIPENPDVPPFIPLIKTKGTTDFCRGGSVLLFADSVPGMKFQWIRNNVEISGASSTRYFASMDGNYQVKITYAGKDGWSAPVHVSVGGEFSANITEGGSLNICSGDTVPLYANTCKDYIYQWKKNGQDIPGAVRSTYYATSEGEYQVKIISGAAVSWSAIVSVTTDDCGGYEPVEIIQLAEETIPPVVNDHFKLNVFPNPSTGTFTVHIDLEQVNEKSAEIQVINSVGQIVFSKLPQIQGNSMKETIELDKGLPEGIYILQLRLGNRIESTRLVLNH
jgi:hypothetical protein